MLSVADAASKVLAKVGSKWEMGSGLEQSARVNVPSRNVTGIFIICIALFKANTLLLSLKVLQKKTHM